MQTVAAHVPLVLLIVFGSIGCAKPTRFDPFDVPREEVRLRVHTIAVARGRFAFDPIDDARADGAVLTPLIDRLREAGYEIVGPEIWETLWERFARDVGPIYDPSSGRADETRWEIVESAVYSELAGIWDADAVLYPSIALVDLLYTGSEVRFCGEVEPIYWPAPQRPRSASLVRGLCLQLALFDMEERRLYGIRAGLEVVETFASQTRARRPLAERLQDATKIDQAIDSVVAPLVELRRESTRDER